MHAKVENKAQGISGLVIRKRDDVIMNLGERPGYPIECKQKIQG